jgi:hypothetical protein
MDPAAAASAGSDMAAGTVTPGGLCWSSSGNDTAVMCLMNSGDNSRLYTALNKAL